MGAGSATSPSLRTCQQRQMCSHLPSSSSSNSTDSQHCSEGGEQERSQQDSPGAPGRSEVTN